MATQEEIIPAAASAMTTPRLAMLMVALEKMIQAAAWEMIMFPRAIHMALPKNITQAVVLMMTTPRLVMLMAAQEETMQAAAWAMTILPQVLEAIHITMIRSVDLVELRLALLDTVTMLPATAMSQVDMVV